MHLIQQNEGVLLEELSAVYESLQEDAVSDENNPILGVDVGLHADLVANHAWLLQDLLIEDGLQVDHCQPPRLDAHDPAPSVFDFAEVLVEQPRHLGRLPAPCVPRDEDELVLDDRVQNLVSLIVDRQL